MAGGKYTGLILVLLSSVGYALNGIISKALLNDGAPAFFVLVSRTWLVVLLFAAMIFFWKRELFRVDRRDLPSLLVNGLMLLIYSAGYFFSLKYLNVSIAVILLYTYPTLVAVASVFIFQEKLTPVLVTSLALVFAGILLTLNLFGGTVGQISPLGITLALAAAVGTTFYAIYVKKLVTRYHSLTINFYTFLLCAVVYLFALPFIWPKPMVSPLVWAGIGGMAVVYTAAYLLYALGLTHLRASQVGIIGSSEPIFSIFLAALLLQEVITLPQLLGALLVLAAIVLLQTGGFRKKREVCDDD